MQSQIIRHTARLARTCPRNITARRTYAVPKPEGGFVGGTNRIPQIAMGSVAVAIPTFYLIQATMGTGNKAPNSGNAEITKSRREGNASTEYRDPRDSGKKTSSVDG